MDMDIKVERYMPLREALENPLRKTLIMSMAERSLNIRDGVPGLEEAVFKKMEETPIKSREKLVLLPSYAKKGGEAVWKAGSVYREEDLAGVTKLELDKWDAYASHRSDYFPGEIPWGFLSKMSEEKLYELACMERLLPVPVLWKDIEDPFSVYVSTPGAAASIIAWMFPEKQGERKVIPEYIEEKMTYNEVAKPEYMFAAISRYKALVRLGPEYLLSRLMDELEKEG